jgi:hypothetical protein
VAGGTGAVDTADAGTATDHARIAAYAQVTMPKPSTPSGGNVYRGESSPFAGARIGLPWAHRGSLAAGVKAKHQAAGSPWRGAACSSGSDPDTVIQIKAGGDLPARRRPKLISHTPFSPGVVAAAAGRQDAAHARQRELISVAANEVVLRGSSLAKYAAAFLKCPAPP